MASRIVRAPRELVICLHEIAVGDHPQRIAARPHLTERLHVPDVAVVAEEVAGAVRDRSDDRDLAVARRERKEAVVLDQDDRPFGEDPGGA